MLRVQMYELSLKQDLQQLFGVPEEKTERMNLSSIFRYYVKHDIRAHPILYVDVLDIAKQRNAMAQRVPGTYRITRRFGWRSCHAPF